jgi:hypothetical protein
VQWWVDFLSKSMVKNNLPVKPEMYRRRVSEVAVLKGMEVKSHPLKAEAYAEIESAIVFRWRKPELTG